MIENVLLLGDRGLGMSNEIPRQQEDGDHGTLCEPIQSTSPKSSEFMNVSLPMSLNQPPSEGGA